MKRIFTILLLLVLCAGVTLAQPANDNCNTATSIIIPSSGSACVAGTLTGATDDGYYSGCETAGSREVWYSFITTGANNTITVSPNGATPATNLVVNLGSAGCSSTTLNGCNAAATANGNATITWAYPVGTQVWVYVSSATNSGGGFQICVNSTTTPPTTGKDCTTAAPLCSKSSFNATVAAGSNGFQPPCFAAALQQPTIFKFTVGQTGLLNWRATPTCGAPNANSTEFDWAVYDVTNGCPGVRVACNYNFTGTFFTNPVTSPQGMQGGPGAGCTNTASSGNPALELCTGVTVTAGNTYIIILDQYTLGSTCSLALDFTGSTFEMAPSSLFTVTPSSGCGSVTVNFNNTSAGASGTTPYSWSFGDGTSSTLQSPPSKTYSSPGNYLVSLTTQSATGCTAASSKQVQVFAVPTLTTVSDTICSGLQATISANASTPGGTYSWSPGGYNTATVNVSPGATTTYTVTYTSADNCTATATATVTVNTGNFVVGAGQDVTVCGNQSVPLNGTVTPAGSYTYQWSGGPVSNGTSLTATANPTGTTTYTLSVTDAGGCTRTDDVLITINGVAVPVTVTATPPYVCPGQQVQLAASILPVSCGLAPPCSGNSITNSIGSGNVVQPGTSLQPPTIFGNFLKSGRNQMLYTAAELQAAIGSATIIKALTFNIAVFNSNAYLQNFTIKMACTNATSLTTWEQNLTTVYTAANYQPQAGWLNGIILTSPFSWDGVSNVIVDMCWNNPTTFGNQNNKASCTTTAFNSYLYNYSSAADMCGTTLAPTASNQRPNIKFSYCIPSLNSYTIVWNPGPGSGANAVSANIDSPTIAPVATTTYTVNISDANSGSCPGIGSITVPVDNSVVSAGPDKNSCPNAQVSLSATVTGTIVPGPASFVWTTLAGASAGTGQTITVTPATTTTYVVTMNGGACVKRDTITVNIGSITATATPTNVTCFGANNGSILAGSAQGTAPYNYQWSANASAGNVSPAINLAPGNYQVTVTDASGCSGSATATITQPTQLSFTTATVHDSCYGDAKGRITVTPQGGTPNYSYNWSNGQTTQTAINLLANTYSVTVYDANQCSATASIVVNQPSQLSFLPAQIHDIRCYNETTGSITVTNNGGTNPYSYSWAPGISSTNATVSNLAAGTYNVTVYDAYQCTASASYSVTQPASGLAFAPSVITNPSCFGLSDGSATVNAAGGAGNVTYLWTPSGQTTATGTNLSAQTYTIVATDDSSCTATTTVTPVNPPQLQITGIVTDVSCFGANNGAIDITVTNAFPTATYNWFTGQNTEDLTGIAAGTYNVTVTDAHNCTAQRGFTVNEPAALVITQPVIVDVACYGQSTGSVTVNNTGGIGPFNYGWSPAGPNSSTYPSAAAGTYDVTITDNNGCTASASYQVNQPASALVFGNAVITNVACNGAQTGSITVNVSGGTTTSPYSYSWSAPASSSTSTASGLPAGQYTVTVTDANGCTLSQTNSITQPTAVTFGAAAINNVSCNGGNDGSALLNPTGGTGSYSYTWNGTPGSNPQTGLSANTYTVVVTDGNNCTFSTTVNITEPAAIVVTPIATDATCAGAPNGSIDANPTGGTQPYNFIWSNGDPGQVIFNLQAGLYRVTVTDDNGCSASAGANVNEPFPLSFTLHAEQVKCPGDMNGSIEVLSPTGGTQPYNFAATPDGANFYYPSTGTKIEGLASNMYAVIMSDNNGCTLVDSVFVPAPIADTYAFTTDSTSCYGTDYSDGAIHIEGFTIQNSPYQFSVDGSPLQYSGDFYGLKAGNHVVLAVNNFGCDTSITAIVPEPVDAFTEILPGDTTLALGQSVQLGSTFGPYPSSTIVGYSWSPINGLSCTDCPQPTVTTYARETRYVLTITYNDHCKTSADVLIGVEGAEPFFVPNSFSPNGDGNNDVFQIYGVGIKTIDLKIFNRWGELVYESNNQFDGWDGTYKGVLQQPGVYVYNVYVTYLNDKKEQKVGSITILR